MSGGMSGSTETSQGKRGSPRLSVKGVQHAPPGMHADGGGLYLNVHATGTRSWIYRYQLDGKRREMGIGGYPLVSLADARARALTIRAGLKSGGTDPLVAKRQAAVEKARVAAESQAVAATVTTFGDVARDYIRAHRASWRNPKHGAQWDSTLRTYAEPVFGATPVDAIDRELVLKVLMPIWATKTETATRVRSRIELVLNYARGRGLRTGENPATWRGNLDAVLPKPRKVTAIVHHPALPYDQIPAFLTALRRRAGMGARALEFAILTAARSGEVRGARWSEVDLAAGVWTIPAARMKARREHRVPLSAPALQLLAALPKMEGEALVFPSSRRGTPLSNMAMAAHVRGMNGPEKIWQSRDGDAIVPHGFRSSFRDWAAEVTHYPHEMAELALAHTVGSKVEAAYRRGDMFEKRRQMMADWAAWCGGPVAAAESSTPKASRTKASARRA
jgi:integrase